MEISKLQRHLTQKSNDLAKIVLVSSDFSIVGKSGQSRFKTNRLDKLIAVLFSYITRIKRLIDAGAGRSVLITIIRIIHWVDVLLCHVRASRHPYPTIRRGSFQHRPAVPSFEEENKTCEDLQPGPGEHCG